ncbi:MAG: hypothetical protein LBG92_08695 [Prevotellaceae bacterium]|jgi:hypothetical protein|nr:hypothetical protein [Prevotellaceae bacterium]
MDKTINNEITFEIAVRKEYFISIVMILIIIAIFICFDIILHNSLLSKFFMLTAFFCGYKYLSWRISGRRIITFDEKHLITTDIYNKKHKSKVYRIISINNLTIDTGYKFTLWRRIKSFWTLVYQFLLWNRQ